MTAQFKYKVVDAFTSKPFSGNPAAVVILDGEGAPKTLTDEAMKAIAQEMNLSETAYITPTDEPDSFGLRWWTPGNEVMLCGHATLASTAVLSAHPRYGSIERYRFQTLSGELTTKKVTRDDGSHVFELDFPATVPEVVEGALQDDQYTVNLKASLGPKFKLVKRISRSKFDVIVEVELEDGDHLGDWDLVLDPLGDMKSRGVCFTTVLPQSGDNEGPLFHSRFFAPKLGVKEDPVTGSLHCALAPLYTKKLGKKAGTELFATQGGSRRGEIRSVWDEERGRVLLRGPAVLMASGEMVVPE